MPPPIVAHQNLSHIAERLAVLIQQVKEGGLFHRLEVHQLESGPSDNGLVQNQLCSDQICGRLESRYRYSNTLVYNNYPWPNVDPKRKAAVEAAAQAVLDARQPHLDRGANLADLYDPNAMPANLQAAHETLDRSVERCYRTGAFHSDRDRFEYLFALYESSLSPLMPAVKPTRRRKP